MPADKTNTKDENKFRRIVETHQDRVINICYRFVHNEDDAEDLAQEVFIQVYRSLSKFREESELSTWIYRIAVNKSLDFIRRRKRKKRLGRVLSITGLGEPEMERELPVTTTPQQDLEMKERAAILRRAVAELPDNQRVAITLSKYEGFSNPQIAEVLGTTVPAVESLLHRAKANLRQKLHQYFDERF